MTCKHLKLYHRLNPFNQKVYSFCSYCFKRVGGLKIPTEWELENLPLVDPKEKCTKIRLKALDKKRKNFLKMRRKELPVIGAIHREFTPKVILRRRKAS